MKLIGFDIETKGEGESYGLQPMRVLQGKAEITSFAAVDEDGCVIASGLNPTVSQIRNFLNESAKDGSTLIGWNTLFDVSWLIAVGLEKEVRSCRWTDGEVMRRALENDTSDKRYGLKPTVGLYLPEYEGYEKTVGGNFDEVNDELLKYNILDSKLTAKLGRLFWDQLDTRRQRLCTIICQSIIPVAKAWVEGIAIDVDAVDSWDADIEKEIHCKLGSIIGLLDLDQSGLQEEVCAALNSPIKLKKILNAVGHSVSSTNKTELSKYKDVPLIKAISDYKTANTSKTKFIAGIRASIEYNATERTYPSCRLWNTYTGRFGYSSKTLKKFQTGIPIHQFPRKTEARNCIVAPKGYLLVECDFATQESRLISDYSGDETLLHIFAENLDFHSYTAARIVNWDYQKLLDEFRNGNPDAKQYRYMGKVANLSCQYRTGWKTLKDVARRDYDLELTDRESQKMVYGYRDVYKGVKQYWSDAIDLAKQKGYAETRGARRVYLDDWSPSNAWSAESTAINFPIQGTAADMKLLGLALVDPLLHRNGGYFLMDLHDALFAVVPDTTKGYEVATEMRDTLSNLPYKLIYDWTPRVALPVDLKIGKAWGSLEEVK